MRIFEGMHKSSNEVIDSIVCVVGSWLFVINDFTGFSLSRFMKDWVASISFNSPVVVGKSLTWLPPPLVLLSLISMGS